jgi:hypothetical protein
MSIQAVSSAAPSPPPSSGSASASDWDFSFHNLLDILNPLEHLPIIGTIYRAITGTHIGIPEKVAGDALYGGLWGAVSSVADVALEQITGKSAEDTVMGWLKGSSDTEVAKITAPAITVAQSLPSSDTPALPSQPTSLASAQPDGADVNALAASLTAKGINGDMAGRALDAYRRMMATAPAPVFASAAGPSF